MLRAKLNTGELVTLATLTREEINKHRKNNQFYCPVCQESLVVKAGKLTIPHFAHYSKGKCPSNKGGEGHYHERGKLLLYQWLKSQHLDAKLEPYLKEIQQQPDILLMLQDKRIAIEFQCARINIEQIQKRNKGYIRAGIVPIWILGASQLKRQGKNHLKIDQFTRQFMHEFSSNFPKRLFYFCPETLQLLIFQDIMFTGLKRAVGKFIFHKLNEMTFLDLFKESRFLKDQLYQLWKSEKKKFRTSYRKQPYGRERAWQQWLYLKGTHLEHLPSMIYLPVSTQHQMKSSPWDWQSRLCLDIIDPLPKGNRFTLTTCHNYLKDHIYHPSYFPLMQSSDHPIQQYLQSLEKINVIKRESTDHFVKIGHLPFYNHVEQAMIGDEQIMNKLIANNRNKIQA